ncbi:PTS sugar transporter subunit IIC [Paenibacillus sp. N1-5-1-14]|uniref:PTS transporter subunit IIC n=1 Tax=Paenibacillus radicibacter TaxID=2972488 RepID=UPI002158F29C|nr:PTS sugar transporter subunit IIC [Paenibacillus radicibacter]MCR8642713.1 PTS sugar transporter subunit IIC [Paenibacillus radicibacter]
MKSYIMDRMFKASSGIAYGILVTLGIGLLIENLGVILGLPALIAIGATTKLLMAPGIGVGIAYMLGANSLTIFSAMAASTVGAGAIKMSLDFGGYLIKTGEPIGALLAATLATYIGRRISGRTQLDMMIVPLFSILIAGLFGLWLSARIAPLLATIGSWITEITAVSPFLSSIVIAVVWGILILSPASSTALAIALQLSGVTAGAALAGCAAHFVGLAVISARENNMGVILAQAICTPKIQLPNITRNIMIVVPTLTASAVAGPVSTFIFGIEIGKEYAGLGISSLVAPIHLLTKYNPSQIIPAMLVTYVLIPAVVSYAVYWVLSRRGLIRPGDLKITT